MRRLISFHLLFALALLSLLVVGCASAEPEPTVAVATSTSAVESAPATGADPSSESQVPRVSAEVPRMPVDELKERLDNGEQIVVVDNRSLDEYNASHIIGAISVQSVNVDSPIDDLALDQEIVLYCD